LLFARKGPAVRKNWRVIALGAIISAAAIALIASQINLPLLWEALRAADYGYLLPASLLAAVGLGVRALRWRALLGGRLSTRRAFHILNISYLLNMLLPLRLGEVARVWLAWRRKPGAPPDDHAPMLQSAGTIVIERLLDLLIVVLFIALALALAAGQVPDELRATGLVTGLGALVGFLLLVILSGRRALAHRLLGWMIGRLPALRRLNLTALLDHLLDGLQPLSRPASLLAALGWTALAWGFSLLSGGVLMLAFYDQIDLTATLLYIAAASFAVAFPAMPGNIGPYEGAILIALGALGYTQSDAAYATATAFAFTVHFMNLLVNAVLGLIGFFDEGISPGQLSQGLRQAGAVANSATQPETEGS
jgi:hypothetical protein